MFHLPLLFHEYTYGHVCSAVQIVETDKTAVSGPQCLCATCQLSEKVTGNQIRTLHLYKYTRVFDRVKYYRGLERQKLTPILYMLLNDLKSTMSHLCIFHEKMIARFIKTYVQENRRINGMDTRELFRDHVQHIL